MWKNDEKGGRYFFNDKTEVFCLNFILFFCSHIIFSCHVFFSEKNTHILIVIGHVDISILYDIHIHIHIHTYILCFYYMIYTYMYVYMFIMYMYIASCCRHIYDIHIHIQIHTHIRCAPQTMWETWNLYLTVPICIVLYRTHYPSIYT